jgi:hypothetical protein
VISLPSVAEDGADMLMAEDDDADPLAAAGPDGGRTAVRHRQQPQLPTVQPVAARPSLAAVPAAGSTASASLPLDGVTDTSTASASGLTPPAAITGNERNTATGRTDDATTDAGNNTIKRGVGRHGGGSKLKKMRYNRKQQMVS